ncbi:MAG TPA: LptF/LptG family permease [Candidatus Angelobacter sp.]|nr:LptF/LptG family permease [Candidatus Angelobacter sp.]
MRIFTRYILKEVVSHGLIGIGVFTFVIFMRDLSRVLELVVRNSAPVPSVAELIFLTLPAALIVTIPMGVLVGVLIGLSRMAADSEITAMRASGVGVGRFLKIVSIFGVVTWLLAIANAVVIAPRSAAALAGLQARLASSQISFEVQPRVFYEGSKNYVLYVQDATTTSGAAIWKNVFLADISVPGTPKITLAQKAFALNGGKDAIRLHLISGQVHQVDIRDQYDISRFTETDTILPLPPADKTAQEIVPIQQLSTRELLNRSNGPREELARTYRIEFHRRFAYATACLVLVLIGVPLGLSSRKGGRGAGFVLTIVLVFIYYFITTTGLSLARGGKVHPVFGVWMANIVFALIGMFLLWRADKMPIEIGLGSAILTQLRSWTQARFKAQEGEAKEARSKGTKDPEESGRSRRFRGTRFPMILDDYVLRSFMSNLVLILASFMVLILIFLYFELLTDIVKNKVPSLTVGEYLLNEMPSLLYLVTPLAVLLSVLVTLGLMQKTNELTAMKATGISIYRTVMPVLVISALLAAGLFLLEQSYLPYANKRVEILKNTIKRKPAQTYLRPDRKWIFGQNNTIYYYELYEPDRDQFGSLSAFEFDPHTFQITKRVYATRAHWSDELHKWIFEAGWERSFRGDAIDSFKHFDVSTFAELNELPSYFKKEVIQSQEMNYEELSGYIKDLQQSGFDVVRLRVQLQKKLAFPLITVVMAVLAVPFALSAGRRGALTGVAIALLIAVVYWVTAGLFEAMGNVSQLPPAVAAWSPDLIFSLAGGYLVLKTPS